MSDQALTDLLNKTGYPLQIGLKESVNAGSHQHWWSVLYEEHSWKIDGRDNGGFIDLVLAHNSQTSYILIECKQVYDQPWCFISEDNQQTRRYKVYTHKNSDPIGIHSYWKESAYQPISHESKFCTVKDRGTQSKPFLDGIASELIVATESFAQEMTQSLEALPATELFFSCMIVTSSPLKVATGNHTDILQNGGQYKDLIWKDVPYIRYRKQLTVQPGTGDQYRKDPKLDRWKERSVMVVNALELNGLLSQWNQAKSY